MSSIRRLAAACGAVVALLAVAACGPSEDDAAAASPSATSGQGPGKDDFKPLDGLPTTLEELKGWKWDDWKNWAKDASQEAFKNPLVKDLWDAERMKEAKPLDKEVKSNFGEEDQGVTDPEPAPVRAAKVSTPYHDYAAPPGKIFFDSPEGSMVCSGTVVTDPANPGKSNLVWTAGHCVHGGKGGGWYRNIEFVPAYNDNGKDLAAQPAGEEEVVPYGHWWAEWAQTSAEWINEGASSGGAAASYDFAVLKVVPKDGGKSLEETVGNALPVWFNAPRGTLGAGVGAYGYPAGAPFDGQIMYHCDDNPTRLSIDQAAPTMLRIGCTMTGGSSGGGWYAKGPGGKTHLVSNTSIGPTDNTWLAGPYLGDGAKGVFDAISRKFGNG